MDSLTNLLGSILPIQLLSITFRVHAVMEMTWQEAIREEASKAGSTKYCPPRFLAMFRSSKFDKFTILFRP